MDKQQLEQLKDAAKKTVIAAMDLSINESKKAQIDIVFKQNYIIFECYSKGKQNGILPDLTEIVHCNIQFPFLYEMDALKRLNRYIEEAK